MTQPEHPQTPLGRGFDSEIPGALLDRVQRGTMQTTYRGVPFWKSPFDITLYLQLLGRLSPATVVEIGTKFGGSALWFADMMTAHGVATPRVISVDIEPLAEIDDPRITFLQGDANLLSEVLTEDLLARREGPLLVVEDSSHMYAESTAVLQFFHPVLRGGDYIVVEDGIVAHLSGQHYRRYENGPNRAVADFLALHAGEYEIDTDLCDRFGYNATYNPNGWLRRL
jgi:cephalosporin hydroxylase